MACGAARQRQRRAAALPVGRAPGGAWAGPAAAGSAGEAPRRGAHAWITGYRKGRLDIPRIWLVDRTKSLFTLNNLKYGAKTENPLVTAQKYAHNNHKTDTWVKVYGNVEYQVHIPCYCCPTAVLLFGIADS